MTDDIKEAIISITIILIVIGVGFITGGISIRPTTVYTKGETATTTIIVYSDISNICTKSGGTFYQRYGTYEVDSRGDLWYDESGKVFGGIDGTATCTKNGKIYDYSYGGKFISKETQTIELK